MLRIEATESDWKALDSARTVATGGRWTRPDGKRFVWFAERDPEVLAAVCEILAEGLPLYTIADAADRYTLVPLSAAGFVGDRYEHDWTLPVGTAADWSEEMLAAFEVGPPEQFDTAALRRFDDEIRDDSPGLHGWRWTAEAWATEHDHPSYDPALHPVAWDPAKRRFAGTVRVWMNPSGPRLGLVAAARPYRRTGLAAALLARAFRVLRERGHTEVRTECDAANAASNAFLTKAGGQIVGGSIELVRHP
ncbi:MAG TPA: GNAT family N-acetyltransferase [Glycomyces sp.]|nr:GNAT family N-acetyltransferase [Glycomyces sp.]